MSNLIYFTTVRHPPSKLPNSCKTPPNRGIYWVLLNQPVVFTFGIDEKLKKIIYVFLISCFSLTIISCSVNWGSNKNDTTSGLFVSVGNSGTIIISSDGITWTFSTSGTSGILWGINYGNSTFVTVCDSVTILTSSDGTSWDERTSDVSTTLYGVTSGTVPS